MLEVNNQNAEKDSISIFPGSKNEKVAISRRFFVAAEGCDRYGDTTVHLSTGAKVFVRATPDEVLKALNI